MCPIFWFLLNFSLVFYELIFVIRLYPILRDRDNDTSSNVQHLALLGYYRNEFKVNHFTCFWKEIEYNWYLGCIIVVFTLTVCWDISREYGIVVTRILFSAASSTFHNYIIISISLSKCCFVLLYFLILKCDTSLWIRAFRLNSDYTMLCTRLYILCDGRCAAVTAA